VNDEGKMFENNFPSIGLQRKGVLIILFLSLSFFLLPDVTVQNAMGVDRE
jgi:hypothetical protein